MSDDEKFEYVTTEAAVAAYSAGEPIFEGLLKELRTLSGKKPEATMSVGKVSLVNRVLADLLPILKEEPSGKYLELLDDKTLPQMSDAVLVMVQFETTLKAFRSRYRRTVKRDYSERVYWITAELLQKWGREDAEEDTEAENEEDGEEEGDEDEDEDEDQDQDEEDDEDEEDK